MYYYVKEAVLSDSGRRVDDFRVVVPTSGFEPEKDGFAKNLVRLMATGRVWRDGRDVEFWVPSAYGKVEGAVPVFESITEALDTACQAGWRGHGRERGPFVYDPQTQTLETFGTHRLVGFFAQGLRDQLLMNFCESTQPLVLRFDQSGRRVGFYHEGLNRPELGHFVQDGGVWARKWPGA